MRKIAQFGKYIRSLAIPPWTSFTVYISTSFSLCVDAYCRNNCRMYIADGGVVVYSSEGLSKRICEVTGPLQMLFHRTMK
jgi:hypothetical protein